MEANENEMRGSAGRERLLTTARRLFTRHGASNVGINDVTAAAGVARMTLYNNFPSKDALVAAVYEAMAKDELEGLGRLKHPRHSEGEAVAALFDRFDRSGRDEAYRGCPFIHASLQTTEGSGPVFEIVRRYKQRLREHVLSLLDPARPNRGELADQLVLLLDGAVTEAYLGGVLAPMIAAKRAAQMLLRATG